MISAANTNEILAVIDLGRIIEWLKKTESSKYVKTCTSSEEQLLQIFYGVTWDGDLISKADTRELREQGLVSRKNGWNFITREGVQELAFRKLIHC